MQITEQKNVGPKIEKLEEKWKINKLMIWVIDQIPPQPLGRPKFPWELACILFEHTKW